MDLLTAVRPDADASTIWSIDPTTSQADFIINTRVALVRRTVIGRFADVGGTVLLNEERPTQSRVELTIRAASIETGNRRRDHHLRTPDFLDVSRCPTIAFTSRVIRLADARANRYRVTGDLTIRDVTRTESFDVVFAPPPVQWGRPIARVVVSGAINRRDFGLDWGTPVISIADDVRISANLVAVAALELAA